VSARGKSRRLQRALCDFGAEHSFAQGNRRLREHYGFELNASAVRETTLGHATQVSERLDEHYGETFRTLPRQGPAQVVAETDLELRLHGRAGAAAQGAASPRVEGDPLERGAGAGCLGVSSRDGITISGGDVLVTRNGRIEKLMKEVVLPNGLIVKPDGTVTNKDGGVATLRPTQVLSFEGIFTEAPVIESTAPKATPVIVMPATRAAPPATPMPATPMPRKGPIQAGEGVQK